MPQNSLKFCQWKNAGKLLCGSLHLTPRRKAPWVIFAHGLTGHRIGPGYLYVRLSRALAQAGIASLRFDFAGSGESDGLFHDMTVSTMRSDLLSAIRLIKRRYAPSHIVLLGHSLGGSVAALCSGAPGVDGLIMLAPIADPLAMVRRRKDIENHGPNANGFWENGPHEMGIQFLSDLKDMAPVETAAAQLHGAIIVFQGDADPSVPAGESRKYVDAGGKAGLKAGYRLMKGSDHNFSTVSAHAALCSGICQWVKESYL
jgi:dienelactone hydrolase